MRNLPTVFTPRARPRLEPGHDPLIASPTLYNSATTPPHHYYKPQNTVSRTSTDAAMSAVDVEVAVELTLFVADIPMITQITLLSRTYVTAVATVLHRPRCLTPRWVVRALARIAAFSRPLRLHTKDYTVHTHFITFVKEIM